MFGVTALLCTVCIAQSIAPQSINSSGTKMAQSNGSLSFTVGELVGLTQTDSNGNSLGSGFSVGATLSTVSILETDASVLDVNVFPNPTTELVNIQINYTLLDQVVVVITDMQGKEVYSGEYPGVSNVIGINTVSYVPGVYMLNIKNPNNRVLGTYKIIKQ